MELTALLKRLHIQELNNMQKETLLAFDPQRDFILLAPTGSGKTLAFSLLIKQLISPNSKEYVQVMVIVPTRELALQIETVLKTVIKEYKILCCYGGHETKMERNSLKDTPSLIIGTPGRIIYHLERSHFSTEGIHTLILDEFDKSLELGFQDQLVQITNAVQSVKRKILTSATDLSQLPDFLSLTNPVRLDVLSHTDNQPAITFKKILVPAQDKLKALFKLICSLDNKKILIFSNHRDAVDHISEFLADRGVLHNVFHGGLEQRDRELAVLKLKNGSNRILITTDLAARGLDIPEINTIIHYQLPSKLDAFTHRNGRTARMNHTGEVILMLTPNDIFNYIPDQAELLTLEEKYPLPSPTSRVTLYIPFGKKDKINKIDIVGYMLQVIGLAKDDIGLIEVKDKESYIAVRRDKMIDIMQTGNGGKIKGNKIKFFRT